MTHASTPTGRRAKRLAVSLLATTCLAAASPFVAVGSAQAGGADKLVPDTHGDCKNDNTGVHNGYDCGPDSSGGGSGGTGGGIF